LTGWLPDIDARSGADNAGRSYSPGSRSVPGLHPSCRPPIAAFHLIANLHRRFKPHPDQVQHVAVNDAARDAFEQIRVRDRVKIFGQIGVDCLGISVAQQAMDPADRIDCAAFGTIPIDTGFQVRLKDRLENQLGRCSDAPSWAKNGRSALLS
jgi:hypothetical protein